MSEKAANVICPRDNLELITWSRFSPIWVSHPRAPVSLNFMDLNSTAIFVVSCTVVLPWIG